MFVFYVVLSIEDYEDYENCIEIETKSGEVSLDAYDGGVVRLIFLLRAAMFFKIYCVVTFSLSTTRNNAEQRGPTLMRVESRCRVKFPRIILRAARHFYASAFHYSTASLAMHLSTRARTSFYP